jgi:hypothetical protein
MFGNNNFMSKQFGLIYVARCIIKHV